MIGALMNQEMTVNGFLHAEDPLSTMNALNQIRAGITVDKNGLVYLSKRQKIFQDSEEALNLGNSGTGLRLMLGLTSGIGLNISFCGDESLSSRPMSRVIKPLTEMGANIEASNGKNISLAINDLVKNLNILQNKISNDPESLQDLLSELKVFKESNY